jgi:hypothetical protein
MASKQPALFDATSLELYDPNDARREGKEGKEVYLAYASTS